MKKIKLILFAGACILGTGCVSTAGPFVTNISSDGRGGLVVEKCMVTYNDFNSTLENTDCTSTTIVLSEAQSPR